MIIDILFQIVPHVILLLVCFSLSYYKYKKIDESFIICLILFLFSALRFDVGWDYEAYVPIIEKRVNDYQIEGVEWLSRILMDVSYHTRFTQFYFIINSVITIFSVYYISKKYSPNPALSLFIFLCDPIFYINDLSIVRNASAISLLFLSYDFLVRKKYLIVLLLIILAGGLHSSGYLGILFVILYFFRLTRNMCIFMFVASFFVTPIIQQFISTFFGSIDSMSKLMIYVSGGNGVGPMLKFVIYGIAVTNFIFWKKLVMLNSNNRFFLTFSCFGAILWSSMSFAETLSLRLCIMFMLYNILLFPSYMYIFGLNYKKIMKQTIMLMFSLYFIVNMSIYINAYCNGSEKMGFIPYKLFFFQDYAQFE